ncbi:MAG: sigma-54-dependent transcriptional regulator [Candidatus Anammoxibacter sp.]
MKKYSILVVDDEEIVRETVSNDLEYRGYDVTAVESGEEAVKLLSKDAENSEFDLIITDLVMEGIDGIEVLKEIKKLSPCTMVIILTGHGSLETAIKAVKFNADDYILKPCKPEELYFTVNQCLKKLELQRKVKLYEKILPVCCVCNKIRDDERVQPGAGEWLSVTEYMSKRTNVDVTHGYCPECMDKLYPELKGIAEYKKSKSDR